MQNRLNCGYKVQHKISRICTLNVKLNVFFKVNITQ